MLCFVVPRPYRQLGVAHALLAGAVDRARSAGAAAIASLMLLIALTGNYGFFNLLTWVLCVAALDDTFPLLARLAPKSSSRAAPRWRGRALAAFAGLWLTVSGVAWSLSSGARPPLARAWGALLAVSGLAVIVGRLLLQRIRLSVLHYVGAAVCVFMAALTVWEMTR